jgi:dienelactone hydrolase
MRAFWATAAAVLLGMVVLTGTAQAREVRSASYNLGDQAFQPPSSIGYDGRSELAGAVFYPSDLARGTHPLIVIEHGMWDTCATGDGLTQWPCPPGVGQIPSYRGYDYLAKQLAAQGFVVVSIGANGINATSAGQAPTVYYARAALINAHLAMWQQLTATGEGPLRGKLITDGKPSTVDFKGHVDMTDVGTMGHSMGGGGAMQQIADQRRGEWPKGVTVRATFALAPTDNWNEEIVTKVPFATMWGTCDQVNTGGYFEQSAGKTTVPIYKYTLTGGNHDFYNTQWSPSSGQVAAHDDALPGKKPGYCQATFPDRQPRPDQRKLTETRQRAITSAYVTAFFQRHLYGRQGFDPLLTGKVRPFAEVTAESSR